MNDGLLSIVTSSNPSRRRAFATYTAAGDHLAWLVAASILGLSLVDGLATLRLLALGMAEANPLMRAFLAWGPGPFLAGKLLLTACSLGLLVAAARCRPLCRVPSRQILVVLVFVYAAVIAYEAGLLWILRS